MLGRGSCPIFVWICEQSKLAQGKFRFTSSPWSRLGLDRGQVVGETNAKQIYKIKYESIGLSLLNFYELEVSCGCRRWCRSPLTTSKVP
jgi:hypothetical protein